MKFSQWFQGFDWPLFLGVFFLFSFGLTALWGLTVTGTVSKNLFFKQFLWGLLAMGVIFGLSLIDYRLLRDETVVVMSFYVLVLILLLSLFVLGTHVRGTVSWFKLPFFTIEPIEFVKITLVVLLAKYFSKRHIELTGLRHIIISGIYIGIPMLLTMLQPDLGSAIVLGAVWFSLITFSGIRFRHFLLVAASGALVVAILWTSFLSPYQKNRIHGFLWPQKDPLGISYNVRQSVIAVGSGQFFGKGLGYGTQSHLRFLPEAETDFIFAAIAEEWGFVGTSVILFIFGFVLWRILHIGFQATDNFARLFSLGLALVIFVQLSIHVGMNIGLLPVTGLTLPFVSYGGSSLLSLAIGIGLMESIRLRSRFIHQASYRREELYSLAF